MNLIQTPSTFSKSFFHSGDLLQVRLELDLVRPGRAFLRTNLGNNAIRLQEIIALVEEGKPVQGRDWQDLPMQQVGGRHFQLTLPLHEVGYFEFKAFFVEDNTNIVHWPRGENASVKVGPAKTVCANTIYNAFVRQFGPNKSGVWKNQLQLQPQLQLQKTVKALDEAGCTVIPPSGTFRDLIAELDFIMLELGFRIIQLLPVHPIPTTFARMGRFGSPFAPLDFFTVDPALAVFDRTSTPMEQFIQLVDEVHARNGLLFLDIPADHTGWGSIFQVHNPEWFVRNPDGTFVSPGAWGVVWEDLCKLDYQNRQLWQRMAEVFLHWCHAGVDGFRCDAGYMIPAEAWDYMVAKVRQEYPDTVFFLEGLGGSLEDTSKLLSSSNLNWAYSELFQQYSAEEIRRFLDFFCAFSPQYGLLVHFAETHDNDRLAARSRQWAEFRVNLCALLAPAGAFGIANGAEWLAQEKIDVHGATSLNWGSADNLIECLQKLLNLLHHHPAFSAKAKLLPLQSRSGNAVSLLRLTANQDDAVLVLCNPDAHEKVTVFWQDQEFAPAGTGNLYDLLSGEKLSLQRNFDRIGIELPPLSCCCLSRKQQPVADGVFKVDANQWQMLRDLVMDSVASVRGVVEFKEQELVRMAKHLHENPREFLRLLYQPGAYLPLLEWIPGQDEHRVVPVPPRHFILLCTSTPFLAYIRQGRKCLQAVQAVPQQDGRFFALFQPLRANGCLEQLELQVSLFEAGQAIRHTGQLALLPQEISPVKLELPATELQDWHCGLASTDLGGYTLARAIWGTLYSQYDALLAANLDCKVPVDRTVLLNRCRAWVVCRDYSRELNLACQKDFAVLDRQSLRWRFTVPTGLGQCLEMSVTAHLAPDSNTLRLVFSSEADSSEDVSEQPSGPISLILRPDIDDRSHHTTTRAFQDAERRFPSRLQNYQRGFTFLTESGQRLRLECCCGQYFPSPEWQYQVQHLLETSRGLGDRSDLFSPGYFRFALSPGDSVTLLATVESAAESGTPPPAVDATAVAAATQEVPAQRLPDILRESLGSFIVRRDDSLSLIAGYPWFLDWGRDTLIALRGLLAAGLSQQCRDLIRQYASYEHGGMLPNMIRGREPANADTSDAPLWLFTVVRDYIQALGEREILTCQCGKRSLLQVLVSIAENYLQGTANGIKVCEETALVFSPAHFTWMDTNHPAATPREGYPVEIQALWIAALEFLAEFSGQAEPWSGLAAQARASFLSLYPAAPYVGLADCLHARAGVSARHAQADDACRPNQLLAITLGAVQDQALRGYILQACQKLLLPGGIRSLADQRVNYPLPVYHQGQLLNDPLAPYWGEYSGDEDTRRKPAYHNGTAWGWMMPSYSEALFMTYGASARATAQALLNAAGINITRGCLGHLPEIFSGDSPHLPRGCCAQAWSESELFRVLTLVSDKK